ncbi:hypothetical protein [Streptococcus uberis]|uniref:hypothetical protein n=1 Tax=Streptococcus uberis TaxID=1349 RepID=UPI003D3612D7
MLYLDKEDISNVKYSWQHIVECISETIKKILSGEIDQPIKPYLQFENHRNRIIAMPARIGNEGGISGIKWIASFPENLQIGIDRAQSITILNSNKTGEIVSIINTSLVSSIRTAGVSAYFLDDYFNKIKKSRIKVLIIGFGPLGRMHLAMLEKLFYNIISEVYIYDKKNIVIKPNDFTNFSVKILEGPLSKKFKGADLVITCTTSKQGYLFEKPKLGSVHLNVSLRDYHYNMREYFDYIIVDKWTEVCRANTDIEVMFNEKKLYQDEVFEIQDIKTIQYQKDDTIFFSPMGMACFDIAIGKLFYELSIKQKVGKDF